VKNYKFTLAHSTSSPTSLELTHSPAGWNEKTITFSRNDTYHSVMRSYSLSLRFVREGMDYIMGAYNSEGVNAVITVTVTKLDKSDYQYDAFYSGILDLSQLKKMRDWVEIPIIDNDVIAKFKSRDEVELNLSTLKSLDGATITDFTSGLTKIFTIEGVDIQELLDVDFEDTITLSLDATPINVVSDPPDTLDILSNEFMVNETTLDYTNDSGGNEKFNYDAGATINYNLNFTFNEFTDNVTCTITVSFEFNGSQVDIVEEEIIVTEDGNETGSVSDSVSASAQTLADSNSIENLKVSLVATSAGDPGHESLVNGSVTITDGNYKIYKVTDAYSPTAEDLILPDEAIQRSLEQMTGAKPFRSNEVGRTDSENHTYASDGDLSLIGLCNGANIRGFSQTLYPFKTSFVNLFKALFMIKPVGFWYNHTDSRWELNEIEDFYDNSEILDIGAVKELEISVDEKYYFNSIKMGSIEEVEYENVSGAQNFAVKTTYTTGIQRIKNEKDITCSYRYDDYGIELTRKNRKRYYFSGFMDGDDQNFMIYGQRAGGNFVTVQGYDNFTTITHKTGSKTIYSPSFRLNLDLSPKRCMLRHKSLLGVNNYNNTEPIRFIGCQFNLDLGLQKSGEAGVIYESDDITSAILGEPLFYPEVYNFIAPVTSAILNQLLSNPHGYITFTYAGTTYSGHILEVSTEPYKRNGNWTLIKHNTNR
jgi:hypothetical protein